LLFEHYGLEVGVPINGWSPNLNVEGDQCLKWFEKAGGGLPLTFYSLSLIPSLITSMQLRGLS